MKDIIVEQVLNFGTLFWRMIAGKGMDFVEQLSQPSGDEYVDEDGRPVQPEDSLHKVIKRRSTVATMSEWVGYLRELPEEKRKEHLAEEDVEGLPPILCAARCDGLEALQQLIDLGADLNSTGKLGGTILHHAVQCGSGGVIDFLLENHKDLLHKKDFHGNTVLHYAVQCDHQKGRMGLKLSRKLIQKGADIDAKNEEGASPLHLAAQLNKEKVIDALLEECDFSEETLNAVDNQGRTPLLTAAAYGKKDAIDCLCIDDEDMNQVDANGRSALFLTVEAGHSVAVKKVLDKTRKQATKPKNLLCKPNRDGDIPLHIAASKGNIKLVKMLLEYDPYHELENQIKEGYNERNIKCTEKQIQEEVEELWKSTKYCKLERQVVQRNKAKRTPLHVAAENGQTDVVKILLDDYPRIIPFCEEHTPDTPLHLACAKGHSTVVHYLLDEGANLKARNVRGETPFHLAASGGHRELVEELIGVNKSCIELQDDKGRTPLRCASDESRADVVSTLLMSGAKIEYHDKSGLIHSVIDVAVDAGHEDVVGAIIDSDAWVEALRPHRDMKHKNKLTPFRMMIQKMPDVATKVLNRCTLKDPKKPDTVKDSKKQDTVVFDYQFLEDFGMNGGKPDDQGEGSYRDQDGRYSKEQHFEAVMKRDKKLSKLTSMPVDLDTHLYKSTHPLMLMVNSDSLDLLEHPLVGSLLHYKWWKFGMWVYVINLLLYLPFLISLTSFALLVWTPESKTCKAVLTGKLDHCSTSANSECEQCGLSSATYSALYISGLLTSLMTWCRLFIEFVQMFQYKQYLMDFTNFLELLLYGSTLMFVSVFDTPCLCPTNYQWQFGILAVFLGWINLLLFVQKFPGIGIYIVMFLKICKTFLRTVVLLLLLLTAFGLAFYMAFDEPEYERTAFSTPARALLRTTAMATGEYDFNGHFHVSPGGGSEDQPELAFLPVTIVIWIMFIAVMPILLINMLTGLAVGDVTEILNAAKLNKLALQLDMVLSVEEMVLSVVYRLPSKKLKRWFDTEKRQEIMIQKRISWWQSVTISLWGGQPYMLRENINKVLNPMETQKEKEELKAKEQANALQREVTDKLEQQMKAVNKKQEEMEKKLQESQKDVMKAVSDLIAKQEETEEQHKKDVMKAVSDLTAKQEEMGEKQMRSMGADISRLQQQLNSLERLMRAMAKHQGIPVEEHPDQRQQ